jgi:hypothetical protein
MLHNPALNTTDYVWPRDTLHDPVYDKWCLAYIKNKEFGDHDEYISKSPLTQAIKLMKQNPNIIDHFSLAENWAAAAIDLLMEKFGKDVLFSIKYELSNCAFNGDEHSETNMTNANNILKLKYAFGNNPGAIDIFVKNSSQICTLDIKKNVKAAHWIRHIAIQRQHSRVNYWANSFGNPGIIDLIEKFYNANPSTIYKYELYYNPAIFDIDSYDYAMIRDAKIALHNELNNRQAQ